MADLGPLYPTADGTQVSLAFSTGTTAWSLINTDPDTNPTTASWVEGIYNSANGELWMVLQDTPANFQTMTSVEIRVYILSAGALDGGDTVQVQVGIATADNTETFLAGASSTTAQQAVSWTTGTISGQVYQVNCSYVNTTANKTSWDNGYLHISWTKSKSGGWDSGTLRVAAIEVNGVYVGGATTETRTHTADAVLKATTPRTHTADAVLLSTETISHTSDAVLTSTGSESHTSDAVLLATETIAHTFDAVLLATETVLHTADAVLISVGSEFHTADAVLAAGLLDIPVGASSESESAIAVGFTSTVSTDVSLASESETANNVGVDKDVAVGGAAESESAATVAVYTGLGVPTGLTVTVISANQLDISWNPVSGATGYDLQRERWAGSWVDTTLLQDVSSVYNDTGLDPDTTYRYRVRSKAG